MYTSASLPLTTIAPAQRQPRFWSVRPSVGRSVGPLLLLSGPERGSVLVLVHESLQLLLEEGLRVGLNQQRSLVQIGDDELLARAPRLVQADHELLQWNVSAEECFGSHRARERGTESESESARVRQGRRDGGRENRSTHPLRRIPREAWTMVVACAPGKGLWSASNSPFAGNVAFPHFSGAPFF